MLSKLSGVFIHVHNFSTRTGSTLQQRREAEGLGESRSGGTHWASHSDCRRTGICSYFLLRITSNSRRGRFSRWACGRSAGTGSPSCEAAQ
jgi:hypothetical protein